MVEEGGDKIGGAPSCQVKPLGAPEDAQKENRQTIAEPTLSRASIISHAKRFLQEDEVRNAPISKKIDFLENKGLERHEIEELLGVSPKDEVSVKTEPLLETASEASWNQDLTSNLPNKSPEVSREVPPIITYPEFLVTPQRSAPLVTAQRLLTTLYLFGGLSALLYGTSNYITTPMAASLTSSRHEFSETVQNNLDRLISRLSGMVSKIPDAMNTENKTFHDEEASDSDPTELFHRDIGVQTSTPESPSYPLLLTPVPPLDSTERQGRRLDVLIAQVKDLSEVIADEEQELCQVSTCINVLREYLDKLAYIAPVYSHGLNGMYGNSSQKSDIIDDEITKVKARIREVKSVLLNARSFPGGSNLGRGR